MTHRWTWFERWKKTSIANKALVIGTALVAVGTLCLAIAAGFQYLTAREQSKAATEQAGTAKEQANVMQRQLNTMQDQANSMRTQTNTLDQSLAETRKSVNAAEKQANSSEVSVRAAQTSAEATVQGAQIAAKGLYISNRPYVGASDITVNNLEDGKEPVFSVTIKNTGITPARNMHTIVQLDPRTDPLPHTPKYDNSVRQSQTVLLSGGSMTMTIPNGQPVKQGGLAIINEGLQVIYVHGFVTYADDLSSKCHVLRFCSYYDPRRHRFVACEYYNREEDQPKCPKPN